MPVVTTLFLLAVLGGVPTGLAQSPSPRSAGGPVRPTSYVFADVETHLHARYPAYVGFEVYAGTLYLNVDTRDARLRQEILQAVLQGHAPFLSSARMASGGVQILQGRVDDEARFAASASLPRIRGLTFLHREARIDRLVIGLEYPNQRDEAERALQAAGVPLDAVLIVTPAPPPLPWGRVLPGAYLATLGVPQTVRQGEKVTVSLQVRNTGRTALTFGHGACDFHLEIRRVATGEVVLPLPGDRACLDVGYQAEIQPGTVKTLVSRAWTAETTDWQALPPGEYEVRAVFGPVSAGPEASVSRPLMRFIQPTPVRFRILAR